MRVILAQIRAASIALRNPDALVVDLEHQTIRRGADRAVLGSGPRRTQIFRICAAILCAPHGQIWRSELMEVLYVDDPSGGPLNAENVLAQVLFRTKPFLAWAGLRLVNRSCGRVEIVPNSTPAHGRSFQIGFRGVRPAGVAA